jgi:hypothetical protein
MGNVSAYITPEIIWEQILALVKNPIILAFAALYIIKCFPTAPIVEVDGSLVKAIVSMEQWNRCVDEVKDKDTLVIVDFYATCKYFFFFFCLSFSFQCYCWS